MPVRNGWAARASAGENDDSEVKRSVLRVWERKVLGPRGSRLGHIKSPRAVTALGVIGPRPATHLLLLDTSVKMARGNFSLAFCRTFCLACAYHCYRPMREPAGWASQLHALPREAISCAHNQPNLCAILHAPAFHVRMPITRAIAPSSPSRRRHRKSIRAKQCPSCILPPTLHPSYLTSLHASRQDRSRL